MEVMMKQNMSSTDRIIRAIAAVVLAVLVFLNVLTGTAAVVLGIVAGILLVTALIGFCPLYALFKLSTNK
jgi:uncharacterized membrane protein